MPQSGLLRLSILLIGAASICIARATPAQPPVEKPLTFSYSGALFGYYRLDHPFDPARPDQAPYPVQQVLNASRAQNNDPKAPKLARLLVGMGDNFAPEFGASIQPDSSKLDPVGCKITIPPGSKVTVDLPQRLYKDRNRYPNLDSVDCDNVARFLLRAGYRAIVPGREDFLYSATWLRAIALGFRWTDPANRQNAGSGRDLLRSKNAEQKLTMLAANLRVTQSAKKEPPLAREEMPSATAKPPKDPKTTESTLPCPLLFASPEPDPARHFSRPFSRTQIVPISCTNGLTPVTVAMDWLSRIDESLRRDGEVRALIKEETDYPKVRSSDGIHLNSKLALRRILLENQAQQMLVMLDALDDQDFIVKKLDGPDDQDLITRNTVLTKIKESLDTLALDSSYILNEHDDLFTSHFPRFGLYLNDKLPRRSSARGATQKQTGVTALASLGHALDTICVNQSTEPSRDLCAVGNGLVNIFENLDAETLFLDESIRKAARRMVLRSIANEQKDIGYTVASESGTLIIGLISPDLMKAVSSTNLSASDTWPTKPVQTSPAQDDGDQQPKKFGGDVTTFDPYLSLIAVLRAATQQAADHPGDNQYEFRRVIVLAQMSREQAETLASRLRYRLAPRTLVGLQHPTGVQDYQPFSDAEILELDKTPVVFLSQANDGDATPDMEIRFNLGTRIPVITPRPPYDGGRIRFPISTATVEPLPVPNTNPDPYNTKVSIAMNAQVESSPPPVDSILTLLLKKMKEISEQGYLAVTFSQSCQDYLDTLAKAVSLLPASVSSQEQKCEADTTSMLLEALRNSQRGLNKADVAILELRDLFYGNLPSSPNLEYTSYDACQTAASKRDRMLCELRVALDRVFWKGDYVERVMVTGSDLVSMLTASQNEAQNEISLNASVAYEQTLASFGIVQPSSPNLSFPGSSSGFNGPQDLVCGNAPSSVTDLSTYCVNGQPIAADAAYWVVTSDHLARDKDLYKVMDATVKLSYHEEARHKAMQTTAPSTPASTDPPRLGRERDFVTASVADGLMSHSVPSLPPQAQPESDVAEWNQQLRNIAHLDISKIVAGFSAREPRGGNIFAEDFQGSTDTRASTPSEQELDLESLHRFSVDLPIPERHRRLHDLTAAFGEQTDAEYDRASTGNLTNKPETVVFALNSLTVSPFVQFRLRQWRGPRGNWSLHTGRALPRSLVVLTPVQYQHQFTGNFLVLPFTSTPPVTIPPTISGQFTVHAPTANSLFFKSGLRHEDGGKGLDIFDKGSYAEFGFEEGTLNNNLQSVSLISSGITKPLTCFANTSVTIPQCFAAYANPKSSSYVKGFQVDNTTKLAAPPLTHNNHTLGVYWDIHLQRQLIKPKPDQTTSAPGATPSKAGINWTLDSKADWFSPRSASHALNTETQFAVPMSIALNFPVFRNLSFSPTYTGFWYASQVTGQEININTFQISAKWYFARDQSVPPLRQVYFAGPASADQTSTSKLK